MTSTITLNVASLRSERTPLSYTYPQQINPQPAYVEMTESGEVSADYSGEIGNSVPMHVWHGRTLRFDVQHNTEGSALADYLESDECGALLQAIHAGHDVDWDGSNHVGSMTDEAQQAAETLKSALLELPTVDTMSAAEFIFSSNSLKSVWSARPLSDAVAELETDVLCSDVAVDGDIKAALLDEAESCFDEAGSDSLDSFHLAALVDDGRITQEQAQARNQD